MEVGARWRVLRVLTLRKLPAALRRARWLKMNEFLVTGSFRKRSPSAVPAWGKQPRKRRGFRFFSGIFEAAKGSKVARVRAAFKSDSGVRCLQLQPPFAVPASSQLILKSLTGALRSGEGVRSRSRWDAGGTRCWDGSASLVAER